MLPTELPSYRKPPVNEVVCGVQFDQLAKFTSIHYGKFWLRVKDEYPLTEDRDPLAEVFEGRRPADDIVPIAGALPLRRVFYQTQDNNYILQVQPSRFLSNWRRVRDDDQYPRFGAAFARFLRGWEVFLKFAAEEQLGVPRVNQYELTYINHIYEATQQFPEGAQEHLGFFQWREARTLKFLPAPRVTNFRLVFPLPDERGALHVSVNHGTRTADKKGVMVLDLTARGPTRSDWTDMKAWFTLAHEWIVKGFTDLTTPEAHRRWEREG